MNSRRVRKIGRPVWTERSALSARKRGWRSPVRPHLGLIPRRLLFLVIVLGLAGFGLIQVFSIKKLVVRAPGDRGTSLEQGAYRLLGNSPWQKNLLTINAEVLEQELLKADPMLKTLEIRRQWPSGLKLTATLKQPSLGWSSGNQAWLLDRDGSVISSLPPGLAVAVVSDGSNLPVTLGQRVTSSRFVGFMNELVPALSSMEVSVTRYEVKETTLDLYVTTAKGYRLVLDTSRSATEQGNDLRTLLGFLSKQGKTPVEYIDLRIAGKAYYK